MKIFLDDIRKVTDIFPSEIPSNWVVCKSYESFVSAISEGVATGETLEFVSFDHDLSDEHYAQVVDVGNIDYDMFREKTGLDCARWLIQLCMDTNIDFPAYHVHSFNPVGANNIRQEITSFLQRKRGLS